MRWRNFTPLIVSLILLLAVPAWADTVILRKGQTAPVDGILFDEPAARQVIEDLRDNQARGAQLETLRSENEALRTQVEHLGSAVADKDRALDIAERREKLHEETEARMRAALEIGERAMRQASEAADVAIKAAQTSTNALEKMQERLEKANTRGFWGTIGGVIVGLLAALALAP